MSGIFLCQCVIYMATQGVINTFCRYSHSVGDSDVGYGSLNI